MELSDNVKYNLITRINNVDLTIVNGLCSPDVLNQTVGPARIFPRQTGRPHVGGKTTPLSRGDPSDSFDIFNADRDLESLGNTHYYKSCACHEKGQTN